MRRILLVLTVVAMLGVFAAPVLAQDDLGDGLDDEDNGLIDDTVGLEDLLSDADEEEDDASPLCGYIPGLEPVFDLDSGGFLCEDVSALDEDDGEEDELLDDGLGDDGLGNESSFVG